MNYLQVVFASAMTILRNWLARFAGVLSGQISGGDRKGENDVQNTSDAGGRLGACPGYAGRLRW